MSDIHLAPVSVELYTMCHISRLTESHIHVNRLLIFIDVVGIVQVIEFEPLAAIAADSAVSLVIIHFSYTFHCKCPVRFSCIPGGNRTELA